MVKKTLSYIASLHCSTFFFKLFSISVVVDTSRFLLLLWSPSITDDDTSSSTLKVGLAVAEEANG